MAQLRKFQFLRNSVLEQPFASYALARTAAETAFAGIGTLQDGEIALYSYQLATTGDTVHTLLGIKRANGIEILGNYDELTAEYQSYVASEIAKLDTPEGGVTGSNNGVSVTVTQVDGKITAVSVDASNLNSAITTAINALDATVRGTSDGVVAEDSFAVTGATGAYVAVEVVEQDGKLTAVKVKENIDETITAKINTLDTPEAGVSSATTNNVKVTVKQVDGIVNSVEVVDNSVNATDVDDAIEEAIATLDSTKSNVATLTDGATTTDIRVEVVEVDGMLTAVNVTDTLAAVAHSGEAADVTFANAHGVFTGENIPTDVEKAIAEVMSRANELEAAQLEEGIGIAIDENNKINANFDIAIETREASEGVTAGTYIVIKDGTNVIAEENANAFVKDGFLQSVVLDEENGELVFTWNTDAEGAGEENQVTRIAISELCDVYTADETYLHLDNFVFSHKTSGVTAGQYAANAADVTVNSTTSQSFKVPTLTVDAAGHVTAASEKTVTITLPASINTAVQTVTAAETEVLSNTKFVAVKADRTDNDVVLTTEYRTQAVDTAAEGQDGLATALDVQTYVDTQIASIDQNHSETTLAAVENGGIKVNETITDNDYAYTVELVKVNTATDEDGNVVIAESNVNDSFADETTNTIRVMSGVTVDAYGRVSGIQYKTIEESWDCGTYGDNN